MNPRVLPSLRTLHLVVLLAVSPGAFAQSPRALNFLEALEKRPESSPLFEQFYNAWLETEPPDKLEDFLKARPDPASQSVLAALHARRGELENAAALLTAALEKQPRAEGWLTLAQWRLRARDHNGALAAVERGLKASPSTETRRTLLETKGRTLAKARRPNEARAVWTALLREHPDDEDLREDMVDLLAESGATDEAVAESKILAAATTDPYRKVLRRLKTGDLLVQQGRSELALPEYTTALDDTGAGSWLERDILRQIETIHRRTDRPGELIAFLEKLTAAHPQRLHLRRRLAEVLSEQQQPEAADKIWLSLLAAAPGDRALAEAFITSLTAAEKHAEAAAQWRALIARFPQDAELPLALAAALHAAGDKTGCAAAVRAFITASGSTEAATLRAAAELSRYRLTAETLALLVESVTKFPASEQARLQYAAALHAADRAKEARDVWRTEAARDGRLLPVARAALALGESAFAYELLEPHTAAFSQDPGALGLLCDAAQRTEKWPAALIHARQLAAIAAAARDVPALTDALTIAVRCATRAQLRESLRKELAAQRTTLSISEKCLLAELADPAAPPAEALALLEEVIAADAATGLTMRVRHHLAAQQPAAAVQAQRRLLASPGGRKAVHIQRLVELCVQAGDFPAALLALADWKTLAPGIPAPWLREAAILSAQQRPADAVRILEQAARQWPDDADTAARLAESHLRNNRPLAAGQHYLRLLERAESVDAKLRWLSPLITAAQQDSTTAEFLIAEFTERRSRNRQSPVPLLALAELSKVRGQTQEAVAFMRDAARLGKGDPALLLRAADLAVDQGFAAQAVELLQETKAQDLTGASVQKRIALLLRLDRGREAGALLVTEAARLPLEQAAQMAAELQQFNHTAAAATLAAAAAARYPENYRMAFLAACLTERAGDTTAAAAEFLRLATTSFPPLPMPAPPPQGSSYQPLETLDPSYLLPESPAENEHAVMLPLMFGMQGEMLYTQDFSGGGQPQTSVRTGARIPGPVYELRALAANAALRLAKENPAELAAVKSTLQHAGMRIALFAEEVVAEQPQDGSRTWQEDVLQKLPSLEPADRDWVLRAMFSQTAYWGFPGGINFYYHSWIGNLHGKSYETHALAAWPHFRSTDRPLALRAALRLVGTKKDESRAAAREGVTLLEAEPYHPSLHPELLRVISLPEPDADGLRDRVRRLVPPWLASLPEGPARQECRALQRWLVFQRDDAAAIAQFLEEDIALMEAGVIPLSESTGQVNGWTNYSPLSRRSYFFGRSHTPPGPPPPPVLIPPGANLMQQFYTGTALLLPDGSGQLNQRQAGAAATALTLSPGQSWMTKPDLLRAVAQACTHPGLKARLAQSLKDDTLLAAALPALEAKPGAPGDLVFCAALVWRQQQPDRAIALLARAGQMEPAIPTEAAITAAAALLLWDGQPVSEAIKRATLAVVERMAADARWNDSRNGLFSLATALGDAALATRLETGPPPATPATAQAALTASMPPVPTPLGSMLRSGTALPMAVNLAAKQPPAQSAATLLASYIRLARQPGNQIQNVSYQIQSLPDNDHRKAILQEIAKQASAAPDFHAKLAAAHLLLHAGAPEQAAGFIAKVIASQPANHHLATYLLPNLASSLPAKAAEVMAPLPPATRLAVWNLTLINTYSATFAARQECGAQLLAHLKELPDAAPGAPPSAAVSNFSTISANLHRTPDREEKKTVTALQKEQSRALSLQLALEYIRTQPNGASLLPHLAATEAETYAQLPERPRLLAELASTDSYLLPQAQGDGSALSASELLVREALAHPAWFDTTLLPTVRKAGNTSRVLTLETVRPLLACTADEFLSTVEKLAAAPPAHDATAQQQTLPLAAIIARERRLPVFSAVLATLLPMQDVPFSWIHEALASESTRGGEAAVNAWIARVAGPTLPRDIWQRPGNAAAQHGRGLMALVNACNNQREINAAAIIKNIQFQRHLAAFLQTLPADPPAPPLQPVSLSSTLPPLPAEDILRVLAATGFLADLPDFRFSVLPSDLTNESHTLRAIRQWAANQSYREDFDALLPPLEKAHGHTFGGRLAVAFLRGEQATKSPRQPPNDAPPPREALATASLVCAVLEAELPRLTALPLAQQQTFLLLDREFSGFNSTDKNKAVADWLNTLRREQQRTELIRFTAMTDAELVRDRYVAGNLAPTIRTLFPADLDTLLTLSRRIASLPGAYQKQNQQTLRESWDSAAHSSAANATTGYALRHTHAMLKLISLPPEPWLPNGETLGGALRTMLSSLCGILSGKNTIPEILESLAALPEDTFTAAERRLFFPLLAGELLTRDRGAKPVLPGLEASALPPAFRKETAMVQEMGQLVHTRAEEMTAAAKAFAAKFTPPPGDNGRYARDLMPQKVPLPGISTAEKLPAALSELHALLTDTALPPSLRMALGERVLSVAPELFDPVLILALHDLLEYPAQRADNYRQRLADASHRWDGASFTPEQWATLQKNLLSLRPGTYQVSSEHLRAAIYSGDDTLIRETSDLCALKENNRSGLYSLASFSLLYAAGKLEPARTWVAALGEPPPPEYFGTGMQVRRITPSSLLTPEAWARAPEFIASLPAGPQRTAAALMIAAMEDSPEMARSEHPRGRRMLAATEQAIAANLPSVWVRNLDSWVATDSDAARVFSPVLKAAIDQLPLAERLQNQNSANSFRSEMSRLLSQKEIPAFVAAIEELAAVPGEKGVEMANGYLRQLRINYNTKAFLAPEHHAAARKALRLSALDARLDPEGQHAAQFLGLCFAVHAAADALPELDAALKAAGDVPALHDAETARHALRFFADPAPLLAKGGSPLALPRHLSSERLPGLLRLLRRDGGLPALHPGMLEELVTSEQSSAGPEAAAAMKTALLKLLPELPPQRDAATTAAIIDLGILAAEAGQKEAAAASLPLAEAALKNTPSWPAAMHSALRLHSALHGPEPALRWALEQAMPETRDENFTRDMPRLLLTLNLADAALLKASGPARWLTQVEERLAGAAPDSLLTGLHTACVLEKLAATAGEAGGKERALDLMALALQAAGAAAGQAKGGCMAQSDREIFTANWAFHAQRAGERIAFKELLPPGSEWRHRMTAFRPRLEEAADFTGKPGRAPLGWKAPGLATELPAAEEMWLRVRTGFTIDADQRAQDTGGSFTFGTLYCAQCDYGEDMGGFTLNGRYLTWSDSGRPELAPALTDMAADKVLAAKAAPARITLLGPQWVQAGQNTLEMLIPSTPRAGKPFAFDAALYALELTFEQAVQAARARKVKPEHIPAFWQKLPPALRGE